MNNSDSQENQRMNPSLARISVENTLCLELRSIFIFFCQRHYEVTFDLDPGYLFQTALTFSLS